MVCACAAASAAQISNAYDTVLYRSPTGAEVTAFANTVSSKCIVNVRFSPGTEGACGTQGVYEIMITLGKSTEFYNSFVVPNTANNTIR